MTACPIHPGLRGRHVGLVIPIEDAMGEWFVVHQCDGPEGSHHWQEVVRDPAALWPRLIECQRRAGGILHPNRPLDVAPLEVWA